jgi:hypothetical protein
MYHIHTTWNSTKNSAAGPIKCGSPVTALHYDPNLACGYASDACNKLNRLADTYNCTPAVYNAGLYAQCQIGDLSGKFGAVKPVNGIIQQLSPLLDYQPPYAANHLVGIPLSQFFSSVVFHCPKGGTKLICAKLQLVPAGQSSICPFPQTRTEVMARLSSDLAGVRSDLVVVSSNLAGVSSDLDTSKSVVKKSEIAIIILAVAVFCLFVIIGVMAFLMCGKKKPSEASAVEIK